MVGRMEPQPTSKKVIKDQRPEAHEQINNNIRWIQHIKIIISLFLLFYLIPTLGGSVRGVR